MDLLNKWISYIGMLMHATLENHPKIDMGRNCWRYMLRPVFVTRILEIVISALLLLFNHNYLQILELCCWCASDIGCTCSCKTDPCTNSTVILSMFIEMTKLGSQLLIHSIMIYFSFIYLVLNIDSPPMKKFWFHQHLWPGGFFG